MDFKKKALQGETKLSKRCPNADEPLMMKLILQATQRDYLKLQKILTKEEVKGWV